MTPGPQRPIALGELRSFEAVARRLSFSAAGEELFLSQSAVSRQIKSLETQIGAALFNRGTRSVELTAAGELLRRAVLPGLEQIDRAVRQIRVSQSRRHINVSTFASFASLWLLPRLTRFQQQHPDIDIRISADDRLVDLDDPEIDVALRYDVASSVPSEAQALFGEQLTPVVSPLLMAQSQSGRGPALRVPGDLSGHTLMEEESKRRSAYSLSWRRWLRHMNQAALEPRGWLYLNYTHQQIQSALAGQGVALARVALVQEQLARGELVEPFGAAGRLQAEASYWLLPLPNARLTPELRAFIGWIEDEARLTRVALGQEPGAARPRARKPPKARA